MIDISIVIPAYNEEQRLPVFLSELTAYCDTLEQTAEILVVADGSTDNTSDTAMQFAVKGKNVDVLRNPTRQGKGYSVARGMTHTTGKYRLFTDADGSVPPYEVGRTLERLTAGDCDILIGSRVIADPECTLTARWYRKAMGSVFNRCVHLLLFRAFGDTQCGFKWFRAAAADDLFPRLHLTGYGFDLELLYLATQLGYRIEENAVTWTHVPGSKVNLVLDSARMFVNMLQVRYWHRHVLPHS